MARPHNTTISISFNTRADMSGGGDVNALFSQMCDFEFSQKRTMQFQFKGSQSGTDVTLNLTGEFTKAHKAILANNGVLRWKESVTVEGHRQKIRKAIIDLIKKPFAGKASALDELLTGIKEPEYGGIDPGEFGGEPRQKKSENDWILRHWAECDRLKQECAQPATNSATVLQKSIQVKKPLKFRPKGKSLSS